MQIADARLSKDRMAQPHWRGRKHLDQQISREPQHSHQYSLTTQSQSCDCESKAEEMLLHWASPPRRIRDSRGKAGDAYLIGFYSLHVPHGPLLSSCHKSVSITLRCLYSSYLLISIIIYCQLFKIRLLFEHNISNRPTQTQTLLATHPGASSPSPSIPHSRLSQRRALQQHQQQQLTVRGTASSARLCPQQPTSAGVSIKQATGGAAGLLSLKRH